MISQQILSRTRLERIIQEFNLYERERKDMIMEDVIEQMRSKDIKVQVIGGQAAPETTPVRSRWASSRTTAGRRCS